MKKNKFTAREETDPQSGKAITQMLNKAAAPKGFLVEWWETGGGCDCIGVTPEGGSWSERASGPHLLISPGNEEVGADSFGGDDWNHLRDSSIVTFGGPSGSLAWDEFGVGFYRCPLGEGEEESLTYIKGTEALLAHVIGWMDNLGFSNGALREVEGQEN